MRNPKAIRDGVDGHYAGQYRKRRQVERTGPRYRSATIRGSDAAHCPYIQPVHRINNLRHFLQLWRRINQASRLPVTAAKRKPDLARPVAAVRVQLRSRL